jgi:hypothetical protein
MTTILLVCNNGTMLRYWEVDAITKEDHQGFENLEGLLLSHQISEMSNRQLPTASRLKLLFYSPGLFLIYI